MQYSDLESNDYSIAFKALEEVLSRGEMTEEEIFKILSLKNKLIISDFLEKYKYFNQKILSKLNLYINQNLDNKDRLFVSDLIEFASYWELDLPYSKCIKLLSVYGKDDDYVVLAAINFISENIKMSYIKDIIKGLENVLYNQKYNQSSQILSSFTLFRITMNRKYLNDLIDLVINGDINNKELLKNILALEWNNKIFFDYADTLSAIYGEFKNIKNEI